MMRRVAPVLLTLASLGCQSASPSCDVASRPPCDDGCSDPVCGSDGNWRCVQDRLTLCDGGWRDAGTDAFAYPDTGIDVGTDAWLCTPTPDESPYETTCDGFGRASCARWVAGRVPGLDAVATCMPYQNRCGRGDACSFDTCTCGDGPECEPGLVCARPQGSTAPRTCVCAWSF